MTKNDTVTCSFVVDRDIYEAYKDIVCGNGKDVKDDLIKYMTTVVRYGVSNPDTIAAIEEVQYLKTDPNKKTYASFAELLEDLED